MHLPDYKEARTRDKRQYRTIAFEIKKDFINKYRGKSFHIKTYGCQMNEHDSENIEALLVKLGFQKEEDYTKADLVLLNTCSIRENAHNKAFGMLGRLKHLKNENKRICHTQKMDTCHSNHTNFLYFLPEYICLIRHVNFPDCTQFGNNYP